MNFRTALAASTLALGLAQATVNYPFPQQSTYDGRGIVLSDQASASSELAEQFAYYLSAYYREEGNYAGINAYNTTSNSGEYYTEGLGYGMLMMVYFSTEETSYQDQFDKLWNSYQYQMNSNGLASWKFGELTSSGMTDWGGGGAATDAEMDVAAALIMAAYQFGDESYLTAAKTLIQNMKTYEFRSDYIELPGDSWGDNNYQLNTSYFAPGYYELFASVDSDNGTFWGETALDANYSLVESVQAMYPATYLMPGWIYTDGNSSTTITGTDEYYNYESPRFPWRMAVAYYWYGQSRAYTLNANTATWVNNQSASSVKGTINCSTGAMGGDQNSSFVASLMSTLAVGVGLDSTDYQTQLDAYWAQAVSLGEETYFEESMKILNGLAVSGNMPNLYVIANGIEINAPIAKAATKNASLSLSVESRVLHLNLPEAGRVDLVDLGGRAVRTLASNASGNVSLSLEGVPSGVYMVRVKGKTMNAAQKIAVK